MLGPVWRALGLSAAAVLLFAAETASNAPHLPQFQDRGEYNLAVAIQNEPDQNRKLTLLNQWADKYPDSAFRQERSNQLIKICRELGKTRETLSLARDMAEHDPYGLGNYWITLLTISLQDTTPGAINEGKRAATTLLANSSRSFSADNCPRSVSLADWFRERDRQQALAHRTLGWVALQQSDYQTAEMELTRVLQRTPNDAEASFWLACALLGENQPERNAQVLYYVARSLVITGDGALRPEARPLVESYFKEACAAIGDKDQDVQRLLAQAQAGPFPYLRNRRNR